MNLEDWKNKILEQVQDVGTYRDAFVPTIDTLASILEQRDKAYQMFVDSGGMHCIVKTSDRGAENIAMNPRLKVWMDLNDQALSLWRDLGLTPSGLKKINEKTLAKPKKNALAEALRAVG